MRHDLMRLCYPVCLGSAVLTLGLAPALGSRREATQSGPATTQLAPAVASVLQVTGTTNRFNITASHADVQSVLKAVFEQAHLQFVPDASVNGEVTLVLSGQPFSVVLASICKQTFLRYEIDRNGIYQISRDDQALRDAFARMRAINGVIADQLRRMGYPLPANGPADMRSYYRQPGAENLLNPGAGGRAGGFGGATTDRDAFELRAGRSPASAEREPGTAAKAPGVARSLHPDSGSQNGNGTVQQLQGSAGEPPKGRSGALSSPEALNKTLKADQTQDSLSAYDQLLRDNGLVGVHVPREEPMPIPEVLQRFGRQANVPILIDPQLQSDHMLKFYGNIVRPLPDALNLLLPTAHLEWRYSGGAIFVTQAPDFGIFYGVSNLPKVVYPSAGLLQMPSGQRRSQQRSAAPLPKAVPPADKDKTDGKNNE